MLNMQIFPLPKYKLKLNRYNLETLLSKDIFFNSFPIHAIHLLIPSKIHNLGCKDALKLPDDTYFIVKNISTAALIQEAFITNFVKNGSLYAFSHGAEAELDNFITIIPSGKLIMSLETAIADSLSLRRENHCNPRKRFKPSHQTYVIDMNSQDFLPGKKLYQAVLTELNKLEHIKFDLLLRWQPAGDDVCSQSIRCYFKNRGFDCVVCEPNQKQHSISSELIPEIEFSMFDATMAENIVEWIGTQICGIEYSKDSDSFISNFAETPQRNFQIASFEGFYTGVHICNLLKEIRTMFRNDSSLPFVAVSISGYQDCYITSNGYQKFSSDDKMICLIVSPLLDCWVVTLNT